MKTDLMKSNGSVLSLAWTSFVPLLYVVCYCTIEHDLQEFVFCGMVSFPMYIFTIGNYNITLEQ